MAGMAEKEVMRAGLLAPPHKMEEMAAMVVMGEMAEMQ